MSRIATLETFSTPFVAFVRVTTDDGQEGWGQCATYHADITATIFHRQIAPHVLGRDAFGDIGATILHVEEK
jgi:L-alanine-DL-glutamate epimerase-like enolase superfamily enzyme